MARQSVSPTTEQAQLEALKSQTGLSDAQAQAVLAGIQENRVKLGLEGEKVGLERSGQAQKERQFKLEAAMQALGLGSQESRTEKTTREGLLEDLTRRPDINTETLASVLSAGGYPQLSTALSTQKAAAREKAITGLIPAIQSAKSDAIREKSIKPALEAQYPGAYQEAVARAFPGTAQRDYSKGGIQYFPPATGTPPAAVAPTESENPLTTLGRRLLSETTQPTTRPVTTADIVAASQGNSPEQKERLFDLQRTFDSPENQAALAEQRATAPGGGTTTVGTGGDQSIGALAGSTVDRGEGGSFTVHLPSGGTARGITK